MAFRRIQITDETILALFKDYIAPDDLPPDAKLVGGLQFLPAERGKLSFVVESAEWKGPQADLLVRFDLRKSWGPGGAA